MPTAEEVLGFSNRWYELGIKEAIERTLRSGVTIRAVAPPLVIATKLAAWRGRGHGDILRSLDVHDLVVLINGRPELADELCTAVAEADALIALAGEKGLALVPSPGEVLRP